MSELNSSIPAWAAVTAHAKDMATVHLRDLAGTDAKRWQQCHVEHDTWLLDYSRQRITQQSLSLLLDLARAVGLSDRIVAMFRGDPINTTEKRAVLHTALRSDFAGSPAIQAEVKASRQKLENYVAAVRSGRKLGITGKKFRHVVNIGIGGSDLGPLLVCDALRAEWSGDITPAAKRVVTVLPPQQIALEKGAELGRFNMGSTVILLFEPNRARWQSGVHAGSVVRLGQSLGGAA